MNKLWPSLHTDILYTWLAWITFLGLLSSECYHKVKYSSLDLAGPLTWHLSLNTPHTHTHTHTHSGFVCLAIGSLQVLGLYTCHLKLQQTDAGIVTEGLCYSHSFPKVKSITLRHWVLHPLT